MVENLLKQDLLEVCYALSIIPKSQTTIQFKTVVKEMHIATAHHL